MSTTNGDTPTMPANTSREKTYILTLERNQFNEGKLFRLSRGDTVLFVLGPSLIGYEVRVSTNSPSSSAVDGQCSSFCRSSFRNLEMGHKDLRQDISNEQWYLKLEMSGSFTYEVYFKDDQNDQKEIFTASGYFVVDPILPLPLSGIQCQTLLSKCLGPFSEWEERLMVSFHSGYNMIHLTPIQELGKSNSAYSVKDHFKVNPTFGATFENINKLVNEMKKEWKMITITDVVLNHAANECPWVRENPDVGYNLINTPHLKPAFLLDRMLWEASLDIASGRWATEGLTAKISNEEDLTKLRKILTDHYVLKMKIEEFFLFIEEAVMKEITEIIAKESTIISHKQPTTWSDIVVIQDPSYQRFGCKVDINSLLSLICTTSPATWKEDALKTIQEALTRKKDSIISTVNDDMSNAVENVISALRYERITAKEKGEISARYPLVSLYFANVSPQHQEQDRHDISDYERIMDDQTQASYYLAHNGWVMNYDPLKNFAAPDSKVYLRRELIAWSDSVKLRFGEKPSDCPTLWETMKKYVQDTARIFDGIRLDNCHSTPLHVAEYLLDAAREVNPNLYVIAELFTSSSETDNIFVNRLGINSLIREAMACPDSHDLGRLVHRWGGEPVGAFERPLSRPLLPTYPHAIFFDVTHDNPSAIEKRTAYDVLPTAAVIATSDCATGSTRGHDEMVPHHIHVVKEARVYPSWSDNESEKDAGHVTWKTGVIRAKKILNDLHQRLSREGYREIFVDQVDANVIAVTRHNPTTHRSVVVVARTCFTKQDPSVTGFIRNIDIPGQINGILFEGRVSGRPDIYTRDEKFINGLSDFHAELKENITPEKSSLVTVIRGLSVNQVKFDRFTPGSVIAFDVSPISAHEAALTKLKEKFPEIPEKLQDLVKGVDLNYLLFRCEAEERDTNGEGVYNIPAFGDLSYAGLFGLMFHWKTIHTTNDLGHPICGNLRSGDWLLDYIVNRLTELGLRDYLGSLFSMVRQIPRNLIPHYFDLIITPLYTILIDNAFCHMSPFILNGSKLIRLLALASLAVVGYTPSAPLPPLTGNVSGLSTDDEGSPRTPTIAAGLPHFSTGYMRNWGRDTFISLRGLLLVSGRFNDARNIILGFAGCLRHGLIPNLLDRGKNPRYNCRDAVWWWLQSIKEYCIIIAEKEFPTVIHESCRDILNQPVRRLFPSDDSSGDAKDSVEQPLHQVMQEALLRHFRGIDFMERNWGTKIDAHMTEAGFRVTVGVDRKTGFIYGGNRHNCGTWMDKMGSSSKAGNRGIPSTPRDGSAVEIVGLSYSVISWLATLPREIWPYEGVTCPETNISWTYREWESRIKGNFDDYFFISSQDSNPVINRRHIYKDTLGTSEAWQDVQLRPNWVIAAAVAPDLFVREHVKESLKIFEDVLLGPGQLGVKTLDPSDWNYRGDYDNSNNSEDPKVAHGANYHNGPEWVWPLGYYLRARLNFSVDIKKENTYFNRLLSRHLRHIESSPWEGLPELTNAGGAFCKDSCTIQAWSIATILDALYDLNARARKDMGSR